MSDFEEQTVNALTILFDKVDTLRHMNIRDMLKPDRYYYYENTLQAAYELYGLTEQEINTVEEKI